jgi:gamma-glutamyl phosphate reductase
MPPTRPLVDVTSIAHSAREASRKLALLSGETRKASLLAIADALEENGERILAAKQRTAPTRRSSYLPER